MKHLRLFLIAILISAFGFVMVQADWETRGINDDYDDLMITTTGGVFQLSPWVQVKSGGTDLFNYYAFRSLSIPNNSVIDNAYLEFTAPFPWNWNQSLPVTIYGLKEGDLTSWNPVPDLGGMAKTEALTNWDTYDLISGHKINVTVTDIVQELYDQFLWYDGNDMGFQLVSIAVSGGERYQVAHDSDSSKAVKLYIEYSEGTVGSEYYYKGFKIEPITESLGTAFTWSDWPNQFKLTTTEGDDYKTTNLTGYFNSFAPDAVASVGTDIYWVEVRAIAPYNQSLMKSSDRGDTVTNLGAVGAGGGSTSIGGLVAIVYDGVDSIHMAYASGYSTHYKTFTVSNQTISAGYLIHSGTNSIGVHRAYWDEAHDTVWFTRFGGQGSVSRKSTVIRRANGGAWESFTYATTDYRQGDVTWADGSMYWVIHLWGGVAQTNFMRLFELGNYSDITDWTQIGGHVGGFDWYDSDSQFDIGTWNNDPVVSMTRRPAGAVHYTYQCRWNGIGWDTWLYNLTGFFPASQPNFEYPKMFYDASGELGMGLVVTQDSGHSLIIKDWDDYQTSEGTPPTTVIKATGIDMRYLGGDMNPFSTGGGGFNVTLDGVPFNNTCIQEAETLEDVQACIDAYLNDTDPFDPDPPASNYPDHENFGRFDIKYYIWIIGQVCIIAPCVAIAWRRFPYLYYPMFVITILVGLGLLWSLSGM